MDYIIKCGSNYIGFDGNGRFTEVNSVNQAVHGSLHKLTNMVNNSVAPNLRKKCKIVSATTTSIKHEVVVPTVEHVERNEASLFDEVMTKLKTLGNANFDQEKDILSKRMSKIDQEVTDIQHYIEFNKLNAAEGYKAYKLLQDKLLERRTIKDDFAKFQMLADAKVSDIFDGTLDANIEEFNHRTYTPRVLKELF